MSVCDAYRRSARYDYTHAVLPGTTMTWAGQTIPRTRRVVVMFRDLPAGVDRYGAASNQA